VADDLHAIDAGSLRFRVDIQTNAPTTTSKGEHLDDWTTTVTRWASITPAAGQFFTASEQIRNSVSHKIVIRYYGGLTPRHRLKFGSRIFSILSVLDEGELHARQTILATEVV